MSKKVQEVEEKKAMTKSVVEVSKPKKPKDDVFTRLSTMKENNSRLSWRRDSKNHQP